MTKKDYSNTLYWSISKIFMIVLLPVVIGCSSANIYKNPISEYQSAVNKTISTIQPYFVELNSVETEFQLYSAYKLGSDWGTQHLNKGIDSQQIVLRIKALQLISDYAGLLSSIVNSTAPEDIKAAATSLGQNANSLSRTISSLGQEGSQVPDVGTPLSQIVDFIGKQAIQNMQKEAIEAAVLNAEQPIANLIGKLEDDLQSVVNLRKQAFAGITTARLDVFNDIRKHSKPEKIHDVIQEIVSLRVKNETIASVDATSLLRKMKSTHLDLVKFVNSDKTPTDISSFADSVDVFATDVESVTNIIQSLNNL